MQPASPIPSRFNKITNKPSYLSPKYSNVTNPRGIKLNLDNQSVFYKVPTISLEKWLLKNRSFLHPALQSYVYKKKNCWNMWKLQLFPYILIKLDVLRSTRKLNWILKQSVRINQSSINPLTKIDFFKGRTILIHITIIPVAQT